MQRHRCKSGRLGPWHNDIWSSELVALMDNPCIMLLCIVLAVYILVYSPLDVDIVWCIFLF